MIIRMLAVTVSAISALTLAAPTAPAHASTDSAGGFSVLPAEACTPAHMKTVNKVVNFNKNILINKPVTINKNVLINKPVTINKNVLINKPVTINKSINIEKNIDLSKHIEINKKIIINKGDHGGDAEAFAAAFAMASAQASASAFSSSFAYAHGSSYVTVINKGGEIGHIEVAPPEEPCVTQWASVVRSLHAECVDIRGEHHPAVRMVPETWIDSSFNKELFRCLEGSTLIVQIGDVVQSDKGLAGIYERGEVLACKQGEALRHFQDGLVKCAIAEKVPDCTERTNLRKYGVGDLFFTYSAQVCARAPAIAKEGGYSVSPYTQSENELSLSGMSLDGGVGSTQ